MEKQLNIESDHPDVHRYLIRVYSKVIDKENRTSCALDFDISWPCLSNMEEKKVGLLVVFDGHSDAKASEIAAKFLHEYFLLHVHFLLEALLSGDSSVGLKEISEGLPEAEQMTRMGPGSM